VIDAFKLIVEDFGTTILLATHDKDLSRHSSMILLLDSGKAVVGPEKPA
jgi:ABC-type lipoprotein export system ATPase subunit